MGERGPAPEPTAKLKRRGSRRAKARQQNGEPMPPPGTDVEPPDWLTDEAAAAKFRQLAPQLLELELLTVADVDAFGRYCEVWARWREMETIIAGEGATYDLSDKDGKYRCSQQRPEVGIANQLLKHLAQLEKAFGLTPSARAGLGNVPKPSRPDRETKAAEAILGGAKAKKSA